MLRMVKEARKGRSWEVKNRWILECKEHIPRWFKFRSHAGHSIYLAPQAFGILHTHLCRWISSPIIPSSGIISTNHIAQPAPASCNHIITASKWCTTRCPLSIIQISTMVATWDSQWNAISRILLSDLPKRSRSAMTGNQVNKNRQKMLTVTTPRTKAISMLMLPNLIKSISKIRIALLLL